MTKPVFRIIPGKRQGKLVYKIQRRGLLMWRTVDWHSSLISAEHLLREQLCGPFFYDARGERL